MEDVIYVGQSLALRWWTWAMVGLSGAALLVGGPPAAVALLVPAVIASLLLPWRFEVFDSGITLWFPFGKYRYLAKERVKVRVGQGSTVLLPRRAERFGYPLTDGLVDQRHHLLRAVLTEHGYDVAT
jgi:hypothetical protein